MGQLYPDPRTIPLGPKRDNNSVFRSIESLLNYRLGAAISAAQTPWAQAINANNFALTGLGGLGFNAAFPTTQGFLKEVWISATRTDSPANASGTHLDPLDGSTQVKFDAIIATLTNIHAHLLPGTFLTRGNAVVNLPSGCWLHGAGMGLTIIQLSSLSGNPTPIMVITSGTQNNPYTRVSDITFDGNATALGAGANNSINAVELDGDYVVIERCEAINMYSHFATGKENFTFKVANWYQTSTTTGYTQPAVGVGILIPTTTTSIYTVGDTVRVQTAAGVPQGWYVLTSINAGVSITGTNQGFASSVAPTTVVASGAVIFNEHGVRNVKIVDCIERLHLGNYGSSFVMFSDYNKAQSGDIIGCKCYDRTPTLTPVNGFGGFTGNQERGRIINCYAENCSHFFYCEGPVANVQIQGCVARNLTCTAFRLNGSGGNLFSNIEINDCDFEINNSADPSGGNIKWAINTTAPTQGNINNLRISNTRIALKSTGATTTYGLLLGMTSQLSLSNVQIDSGLLNNFDATNINKFTLFDNVTTPDGNFITLTGNNGLPGTIICRPDNDAVTSGNVFLSFYAQAKLIYPNNAAQSATNRVTILVLPAKYDFGSQTWTIDDNTKFIDVVGLGQRDDVYFTSSADCALISAGAVDFRWKSFTLNTSSASASVYGLNRTGGTSTTEVMEDIVLNGAGTWNSIKSGGGALWGGTYRRIKFANGGFFGQGQSEFDGTAEYIEIGANGTSNCYISATARLSYFVCKGQLNLFSNNGVVEYGRVSGVTANQDAILEQSIAIGNGGVYRYLTLIANGSGTAIKNSGGARSVAVYFCSSNADLDNSITNLISPGQQFNIKDATNITI